MVTCKILDSGNLLITANNETRKWIAGAFAVFQNKTVDICSSIMCDVFESYSCNGSYTPFDAGNGRPFVGLTDAPCIAEAMNYDEEGEPLIDGRLWWFPDYMIRDPLQELKNKGRVVFMLAEREQGK